jgi:hypothetical protein
MIPAFTAERSLGPCAGVFVERTAPSALPVVPAFPPCEACDIICQGKPDCHCYDYCE